MWVCFNRIYITFASRCILAPRSGRPAGWVISVCSSYEYRLVGSGLVQFFVSGLVSKHGPTYNSAYSHPTHTQLCLLAFNPAQLCPWVYNPHTTLPWVYNPHTTLPIGQQPTHNSAYWPTAQHNSAHGRTTYTQLGNNLRKVILNFHFFLF